MADLHIIEAEPIAADLVERLEQALALAREDKLSSVAIALVYRDGSTGDAWSQPPSMGALIGATALLQAHLIQALDE